MADLGFAPRLLEITNWLESSLGRVMDRSRYWRRYPRWRGGDQDLPGSTAGVYSLALAFAERRGGEAGGYGPEQLRQLAAGRRALTEQLRMLVNEHSYRRCQAMPYQFADTQDVISRSAALTTRSRSRVP